ncbi:MAG: ribosomal protein S18-alanine N-acetyltransferase [Clostridia bacterium]|nr:ribosomal protein S18-alanine N-acetyltransferase [Clostridia bacterium]
MTIVPMTERHVPALVELEAVCFPHPWTAAGFAEELHNPLAVFLVAEQDGAVAGYMGFHDVVGEGFVTNVAVFPAFRRQGVAAALISAAQAICRERGIARLALEVRESNAAAIALYERFGFRQDGRRPRFYTAPAEDALLYSWENQNLPL